ncbi:MAG: hypothetical protein K6E30_07570 [Lachnospiraceae bacterium]|nr:hypothetical protein [Lachnospiraceae bacterium]
MSERTKIFLDQGERTLQKKLKDSYVSEKTDLWPAVQRAVAKEPAQAISGTRRAPVSRRVWVAAAALAAVLGLMGAGIFKHWSIYDSSGKKETLAQEEAFEPGDGYAAMKPAEEEEAFSKTELYYAYDWVENENLIPGGLQIPGNTAEEQNIPELKEKLIQIPQGSLVEISTNGIDYAEVQGSFTSDYEICKETIGDNALGIRLPEESLIPSEYREHLSFTSGYYITEKDYASREESASEKTERYTLQSYLLPESVRSQTGWYALEWFKADKSPIICTAYLAENDEMYIPVSEEKDRVKPLAVDGFDKALNWEHYNEAYDAQEITLMLWQKIDPVTVLELGYGKDPAPSRKQYIVYMLDAVGITADEALRIAEEW